MLILVGVSINVLIQSNILGSAKNAGEKYRTETEKEAGQINVTIGETEYSSKIDGTYARIDDPENSLPGYFTQFIEN